MTRDERIFIIDQCGKLESVVADLTQLTAGIGDGQSFIRIAIREQIAVLEDVRAALVSGTDTSEV